MQWLYGDFLELIGRYSEEPACPLWRPCKDYYTLDGLCREQDRRLYSLPILIR